MPENQNEEVDALCKECGHAFKAYVDRLLPEENANAENTKTECPVCGCSECKIGKQMKICESLAVFLNGPRLAYPTFGHQWIITKEL